MKITVFGSGYVGLVTSVCLSHKGFNVICIEKDDNVIEQINNGDIPFFETGLHELFEKNIGQKLKIEKFSEDIVKESDIIFIAVGTPSDENGINLDQVKSVLKQVGNSLNNSKHTSIVIKSTVLPKTTDTLAKKIIEENKNNIFGKTFGLGMNPEFLREGNAVEDFLNPDRIVIGFEDELTKQKLTDIYEIFDSEIIYTNSRTAEFIKYVNNSLLALLISTNNEFANIAEKIGGISYSEVIKGVSSDNRWSINHNDNKLIPKIFEYFYPGYGYGGSCFPKDVKALYEFSKSVERESKILKSTIEINENQTDLVKRAIVNSFESYSQKKVLILGTSFKPNTDDIRNSVSIKIAEVCLNLNLNVYVHDPMSVEKFVSYFNNKVKSVESWEAEIFNFDIIILSTVWDEYKILDKVLVDKIFDKKLVIDARGIFNEKNFDSDYFSLNT